MNSFSIKGLVITEDFSHYLKKAIGLSLVGIVVVMLQSFTPVLAEDLPRNKIKMVEAKPITTAIKNYIFGHSLVVHPPKIPTPNDETAVPYWLAVFSQASGFKLTSDGQFGFMFNHTKFEPRDQWYFDKVKSGWRGSFAKSKFTTVMFTLANFIQYKHPKEPYDGNNAEQVTPLGLSLKLIDRAHKDTPEATYYIYENWPDMGYLPFPPAREKLVGYHRYTLKDFHPWWPTLQDSLKAARPDLSIKLLPVGSIIAKLLLETELKSIPVEDLYEDNAPHGRPTIYFLAGLVSFMGMYGVPTPADFQVPDTVHVAVKDNYTEVVNFVWKELQSFNYADGSSRVW